MKLYLMLVWLAVGGCGRAPEAPEVTNGAANDAYQSTFGVSPASADGTSNLYATNMYVTNDGWNVGSYLTNYYTSGLRLGGWLSIETISHDFWNYAATNVMLSATNQPIVTATNGHWIITFK